MHVDMYDMHLLSYYLNRRVLLINGGFSTKNKTINILHYYVPIKQSKYQAIEYAVMINSINDMH